MVCCRHKDLLHIYTKIKKGKKRQFCAKKRVFLGKVASENDLKLQQNEGLQLKSI